MMGADIDVIRAEAPAPQCTSRARAAMARFMPRVRPPRFMQVAVLEAPRRVSLSERPMPTPAADEVLVRVRAVGICGSDVH